MLVTVSCQMVKELSNVYIIFSVSFCTFVSGKGFYKEQTVVPDFLCEMLDVKPHNLEDSRFEPDRRKLENQPYTVSCYVLCSLTIIIIINICVQVCSFWRFMNCVGFTLS